MIKSIATDPWSTDQLKGENSNSRNHISTCPINNNIMCVWKQECALLLRMFCRKCKLTHDRSRLVLMYKEGLHSPFTFFSSYLGCWVIPKNIITITVNLTLPGATCYSISACQVPFCHLLFLCHQVGQLSFPGSYSHPLITCSHTRAVFWRLSFWDAWL